MIHPIKTLIVGAAMLVLPMAAQAQQAPAAPGAAPAAPAGRQGMAPQHSDPLVQYRVDVMAGLQRQSAALGAISQKRVPHDANVALHAQTIALIARQALKAFEPKAAGGTAKPEIWDNWKDFSEKMVAMDVAATALAKKAAAGPVTAEDIATTTGACRGCHMTYRVQQQRPPAPAAP